MPPCAGRSTRSPRVFLLALALVACAAEAWAQGSSIDFSAFADVPYSNAEEVELQQHVDDHNAFSSSEFIVHLGDTKGGTSNCVEDHYTDPAAIFNIE